MRTRRHLTSLLFASLALTAGCGGGESTGPGGNGNPGTAKVTAKIDGAAFSDASAVNTSSIIQVLPGAYSMVVVGTLGSTLHTLALSMYNIRGTGTYPIGVGPQVAGASATFSNSSGQGWGTPSTGADGTLTITELSNTRMVGTFNLTVTPLLAGTSGNRTITDGAFALTVTQQGTIGALPENAGSKVSAVLGGVAFNAAAATANYSTTTNLLVVIGSNNSRTVSLTLSGITGIGTFALSNTAPTRQIGVTLVTPTTQVWSSAIAGGSGTVTITTFSAARIAGTYSATLAPSTGATGSLAITNGTFDVGRQ